MILERFEGPPKGWRYQQPETGRIFNHYDLESLEREIEDYRRGNGLPLPANWREMVEKEICEQNPEWGSRWCGDAPTTPGTKKRRIRVADVLRFLAAVETLARNGWRAVPQEEAERRASICATCPLNVRVGCLGCNGVAKMARNLLGKRRTLKDEQLQNCEVCGCVLKLKVHMPLEPDGLTYPANCWQAPAQVPSPEGPNAPGPDLQP